MDVRSLLSMARKSSFCMAAAKTLVMLRVVECRLPAQASKSKPWGFSNTVSVQPSSFAFSFMASMNTAYGSSLVGSICAPAVVAIAVAASLPLMTMSPVSASSMVSVSPSKRPRLDSPTVAAAWSTVTVSERSQCSSATRAVMTLVTEAILMGSSASRSK